MFCNCIVLRCLFAYYVLFCFVFWIYFIIFYFTLCCIALHCIVLYCIVFCIVICCAVSPCLLLYCKYCIAMNSIVFWKEKYFNCSTISYLRFSVLSATPEVCCLLTHLFLPFVFVKYFKSIF